jgi:hypothetical protein
MDGINIELTKYASATLNYRSLDLLNKTGYIPEDWSVAIVMFLYKKETENCENYRCMAYKLYARSSQEK